MDNSNSNSNSNSKTGTEDTAKPKTGYDSDDDNSGSSSNFGIEEKPDDTTTKPAEDTTPEQEPEESKSIEDTSLKEEPPAIIEDSKPVEDTEPLADSKTDNKDNGIDHQQNEKIKNPEEKNYPDNDNSNFGDLNNSKKNKDDSNKTKGNNDLGDTNGPGTSENSPPKSYVLISVVKDDGLTKDEIKAAAYEHLEEIKSGNHETDFDKACKENKIVTFEGETKEGTVVYRCHKDTGKVLFQKYKDTDEVIMEVAFDGKRIEKYIKISPTGTGNQKPSSDSTNNPSNPNINNTPNTDNGNGSNTSIGTDNANLGATGSNIDNGNGTGNDAGNSTKNTGDNGSKTGNSNDDGKVGGKCKGNGNGTENGNSLGKSRGKRNKNKNKDSGTHLQQCVNNDLNFIANNGIQTLGQEKYPSKNSGVSISNGSIVTGSLKAIKDPIGFGKALWSDIKSMCNTLVDDAKIVSYPLVFVGRKLKNKIKNASGKHKKKKEAKKLAKEQQKKEEPTTTEKPSDKNKQEDSKPETTPVTNDSSKDNTHSQKDSKPETSPNPDAPLRVNTPVTEMKAPISTGPAKYSGIHVPIKVETPPPGMQVPVSHEQLIRLRKENKINYQSGSYSDEPTNERPDKTPSFVVPIRAETAPSGMHVPVTNYPEQPVERPGKNNNSKNNPTNNNQTKPTIEKQNKPSNINEPKKIDNKPSNVPNPPKFDPTPSDLPIPPKVDPKPPVSNIPEPDNKEKESDKKPDLGSDPIIKKPIIPRKNLTIKNYKGKKINIKIDDKIIKMPITKVLNRSLKDAKKIAGSEFKINNSNSEKTGETKETIFFYENHKQNIEERILAAQRDIQNGNTLSTKTNFLNENFERALLERGEDTKNFTKVTGTESQHVTHKQILQTGTIIAESNVLDKDIKNLGLDFVSTANAYNATGNVIKANGFVDFCNCIVDASIKSTEAVGIGLIKGSMALDHAMQHPIDTFVINPIYLGAKIIEINNEILSTLGSVAGNGIITSLSLEQFKDTPLIGDTLNNIGERSKVALVEKIETNALKLSNFYKASAEALSEKTPYDYIEMGTQLTFEVLALRKVCGNLGQFFSAKSTEIGNIANKFEKTGEALNAIETRPGTRMASNIIEMMEDKNGVFQPVPQNFAEGIEITPKTSNLPKSFINTNLPGPVESFPEQLKLPKPNPSIYFPDEGLPDEVKLPNPTENIPETDDGPPKPLKLPKPTEPDNGLPEEKIVKPSKLVKGTRCTIPPTRKMKKGYIKKYYKGFTEAQAVELLKKSGEIVEIKDVEIIKGEPLSKFLKENGYKGGSQAKFNTKHFKHIYGEEYNIREFKCGAIRVAKAGGHLIGKHMKLENIKVQENGSIEAIVPNIDNKGKYDETQKTFFPQELTPAQINEKIRESFGNIVEFGKDGDFEFTGITKCGLKILSTTDENGNLITSYIVN